MAAFIVFHNLLNFFNLFCVNSCTYKSMANLIKPLINGTHHQFFKWSKSYIYVYRNIDQNSYGLPVVLYTCWELHLSWEYHNSAAEN